MYQTKLIKWNNFRKAEFEIEMDQHMNLNVTKGDVFLISIKYITKKFPYRYYETFHLVIVVISDSLF